MGGAADSTASSKSYLYILDTIYFSVAFALGGGLYQRASHSWIILPIKVVTCIPSFVTAFSTR